MAATRAAKNTIIPFLLNREYASKLESDGSLTVWTRLMTPWFSFRKAVFYGTVSIKHLSFAPIPCAFGLVSWVALPKGKLARYTDVSIGVELPASLREWIVSDFNGLGGKV